MTHQQISFVKSALRIVAYLLLLLIQAPGVGVAVIALVASEILGIAEEIGH